MRLKFEFDFDKFSDQRIAKERNQKKVLIDSVTTNDISRYRTEICYDRDRKVTTIDDIFRNLSEICYDRHRKVTTTDDYSRNRNEFRYDRTRKATTFYEK